MKLNKNLYLILVFTALVLTACGGSGGDDSPPPPPPPMTGGDDDDGPAMLNPSSATLIFPEDETECNTGIVDPNDEAFSTVTFEWNASQNTDSYTIRLTNLNTGSTSSANSTTNSADIRIQRGTPYSWFVISRATGNPNFAESSSFRFYNEGPGIENYAPFPAEAISPSRGATIDATTTVTLVWEGNDIDDDITEYEVFFSTDVSALTSIGTTTTPTLEDMMVASGNTYFWQVATTDSAGNISTSEIFEFRVN